MKNDDLYNYMMLPTRMIHQSFRYVLGRMTGAVSTWVDWAVDNWKDIPEEEKVTIRRELKQAFDLYNKDTKNIFKYLGMSCNREQWIKLNRVIELERLDKLREEGKFNEECGEIEY